MSTVNRILQADHVSFACFFVGTGAFTYLYGRESLFQKHYIGFIQKHHNKEPVPVHNILKFRLETVLDDLKISKYNREFYDLFITKELDPITCGATSVRQGVKVGIPEYYQAASSNGIKVANSTIHRTKIPWSSEEGEKLLQSLSLSEAAQKFAMAQAILMGDNYYHFFNASFPPFFCWGYLVFTQKILSYKKMHLRSSLFTLSTYILTGIVLAAAYVFCDNVLYLQYDKVTFEDALKISHSYILGGIEYYEKQVERNKALRNIIKGGDNYYDEDGDSTSILSPTGLPSSVKLILAKEQLKEYSFHEEAMTPPPVNPDPYPIH